MPFLHSPSRIINPLAHERRFGFGSGMGGSGASFTGSLDSYTANLDAAWSVSRRLLASYTGSLVRVRRSSDNTEQDIGSTSDGSLDTTALLAFTGGGNGFVCKIYAQTGGSAKDYVQTSAAAQLRIVNAGSVVTAGTNNRPAAEVITGSVQFMATAAFTALTSASMTMSAFFRGTANVPAGRLFGGAQTSVSADSAAGGWLPAYLTTGGIKSFESGDRASLSVSMPVNLSYSSLSISSGHTLRIAGSSNTSSFSPASKNIAHWLLFCYGVSMVQSHTGDMFGEACVWTANRDSDQAAIIAERNTFFGAP